MHKNGAIKSRIDKIEQTYPHKGGKVLQNKTTQDRQIAGIKNLNKIRNKYLKCSLKLPILNIQLNGFNMKFSFCFMGRGE